MSDKEARVLGSGDTIEVDGKTYQVNPVTVRELHRVQREAVKFYRRQVLESYVDNIDLISRNGNAQALIERKADEVSKYDIDDCPVKRSHDVSRIEVTQELKSFLEDRLGELPTSDKRIKILLAIGLDQGALNVDDLKDVIGFKLRVHEVPYDSWWVTGTYDGMVAMAWAAVSDQVKREEVMQWPLEKLQEAAKKSEAVTTPAVGNTSGSPS